MKFEIRKNIGQNSRSYIFKWQKFHFQEYYRIFNNIPSIIFYQRNMKVNILCIKMHNLSSSSNMKTFLIEKKKKIKDKGKGRKASWKQRSRVDTRIVNQPFHFSQKHKYHGSFVLVFLIVKSTYQNDHEKLLWLNIISTNFNLLSWWTENSVYCNIF